MNDYLGHRPVAVLRTQQKIQPYAHEWVRPIPLWIRGAGVAVGRYRELVERAMAILDATDPMLLLEAMFDPASSTSWPSIPAPTTSTTRSTSGPIISSASGTWASWTTRAAAAVSSLQQVALDAMLERLADRGDLPYEEVLFEEAAVLAGTMLMGSGISGNRPDAHDSSVTLVTLVQQIAVYRDAFYERLWRGFPVRTPSGCGPRPWRCGSRSAAARQHFNQHLARRRAEQLQHVHLAQLFARMGYTRRRPGRSASCRWPRPA